MRLKSKSNFRVVCIEIREEKTKRAKTNITNKRDTDKTKLVGELKKTKNTVVVAAVAGGGAGRPHRQAVAWMTNAPLVAVVVSSPTACNAVPKKFSNPSSAPARQKVGVNGCCSGADALCCIFALPPLCPAAVE